MYNGLSLRRTNVQNFLSIQSCIQWTLAWDGHLALDGQKAQNQGVRLRRESTVCVVLLNKCCSLYNHLNTTLYTKFLVKPMYSSSGVWDRAVYKKMFSSWPPPSNRPVLFIWRTTVALQLVREGGSPGEINRPKGGLPTEAVAHCVR